MFQVLRNAWKITDLRKKILYTLFIILIFRIGSAITIPFIDAAAIANAVYDATGVRMKKLPLTPENVLAELKAAGVAE